MAGLRPAGPGKPQYCSLNDTTRFFAVDRRGRWWEAAADRIFAELALDAARDATPPAGDHALLQQLGDGPRVAKGSIVRGKWRLERTSCGVRPARHGGRIGDRDARQPWPQLRASSCG